MTRARLERSHPRSRIAAIAALLAMTIIGGAGCSSAPPVPKAPERSRLPEAAGADEVGTDAAAASLGNVSNFSLPDAESAKESEAFAMGSPRGREVGEAVVHLAPGIEVDRGEGEVRVAGQAALDEGWLEQAVCLAGTREHESLVVIESPPRMVHAALLMLGLEAGRPGSWRLEDDGETIRREAPVGAALELHVRFTRPDGVETTVPLSTWVETPRGGSIELHPWRFAGSRLEARRDGGEAYAADFSGSVVGLVTFGDEVVAFAEVRSDQVAIDEAGFLVRRGTPPPPGTPVTLVFRAPRAP